MRERVVDVIPVLLRTRNVLEEDLEDYVLMLMEKEKWSRIGGKTQGNDATTNENSETKAIQENDGKDNEKSESEDNHNEDDRVKEVDNVNEKKVMGMIKV
nr:hypothetical protein [Tanacetum cinerariifolium]